MTFSTVKIGSNTSWSQIMLLERPQYILKTRRCDRSCRTCLVVGAKNIYWLAIMIRFFSESVPSYCWSSASHAALSSFFASNSLIQLYTSGFCATKRGYQCRTQDYGAVPSIGEISVFRTWFGLMKSGRLGRGSKRESRTKDLRCSCNQRI